MRSFAPLECHACGGRVLLLGEQRACVGCDRLEHRCTCAPRPADLEPEHHQAHAEQPDTRQLPLFELPACGRCGAPLAGDRYRVGWCPACARGAR